MKTLITRVRNLLVLLLCAAPLLIWAISPSIQGLSVTTVPQLKFAQAQIQRLATNLTPFTQTATSPYSRGAISYSSTQPDVASVNASTGEVTPKKVGETRIVATQQAATPFPAATATYTVQLTGAPPVFDTWTLPSKTFTVPTSYNIGTGASDLPPAKATNSTGAISYRLKDPATMASIATVTTQNNITTVNILKKGKIILVAELAATPQVAAGSIEAPLDIIGAVPNSVPPVELAYGTSLTISNQVPGVTGNVTYRVLDNNVATVGANGLTINARNVGSTTLFAVQNNVDVASGTLTVIVQTPPTVTVTQALPDPVRVGQEYTIKVSTTSPVRLPLAMSNTTAQQYLDASYWNEVLPSTPASRGPGPNFADVYVVTFKNPDGGNIPIQALLRTPETWTFTQEWSLGTTTLSPISAGSDVAFPRATPYEFTLGTTPTDADAAIPANVIVTEWNDTIARLELVSSTPAGDTYKLVPVGVGTYTLKGTIKGGVNDGRTTSITVTVKPQPTVLSGLTPITLTTDSNRVEVRPPVSSRPGTPSFTYKIPDADSNIATLVFEGGKYYVKPVGTGTTALTITQAAAGNYAEGSTSIPITVNAGAPPITAFLGTIVRTYGEVVDVLMPLPTTGFNPDQVQGGTITFSFNDTVPNTNGPVASAVMDSSGKIRIGILHAGTTQLTVTQGTSTATADITVNKGTPSLQYTGGTIALQQGQCRNSPDMVGMPLLNAGSNGNGALYSTSDGAITYSISNTSLMTFGTRLGLTTPYNEAYVYGVQPNNSASLSGDPYSLTVNQAGTADYQSASVTVPNVFFIKGLINDFPAHVYNCGPV